MHKTGHRDRRAGRAGRRWRLGGMRIAVVAAAAVLVTSLASAAPASAAVVIAGSSWLGGKGVDVCYPYNQTCGNNVSTTSPYGFQCVDLPQRLYYKLGWYGREQFAGVDYAYQIYADAASLGFQAHANGSGYTPVPGDMIVEGATSGNSAGHVAVVDHVSGDSIYATEENASPTGWHTYTLSGSTITGGYGPVLGTVHAPADHLGSPPPNPPANPPAVAVTGSGTAYVFWKGTEGNLWEAQGPADGALGAPYRVGMGPLGSAPAVGVDSKGDTYVYWKGTNGNLWEAYWTGSKWTGPIDQGMGTLGSAPAVAVTGNGTAYVFWKGGDGQLWEAQGAGNGQLAGPYPRGMGPLGSGPTAEVNSSGDTYVYWQGTNGNLWEAYWTGSKWAGPVDQGMGTLGSAPSVAVTGNGTAYVFWKGTDGHLWEAQGSATGQLGGPYPRGMGTLGSAPAAGVNSSGYTYVYWKGTDANLWEGYWNGSSWAGPVNRGEGPLG